MKSFVVGIVLVAALLIAVACAAPEPEPAKGARRVGDYVSPKFRAAAAAAAAAADDDDDDDDDDEIELRQLDGNKTDASSGRLFMKKFLLFKNIFGNSNQQPVIPIIITGAAANTGPATSPTLTSVTTTGSIPSATGTITTSPITSAPVSSRLAIRTKPKSKPKYEDEAEEEAEEEEEEVEQAAAGVVANQAAVVDEQALQAALAAGAQEYIVTEAEIKGTSDSKAVKQPGRINLRRPGARKGQVISVRIPPKYRRYFQNGQKVMLNTNNKGGKRRVVKRRGGNKNKNVRRRRINKNRRTNAFLN